MKTSFLKILICFVIFLSVLLKNNIMSKVFYELVRTAPKGRWNGIQRIYAPDVVRRLRSAIQIEYTLAVSYFKVRCTQRKIQVKTFFRFFFISFDRA